jgi:hypothetical protein
MGQSRICLDAGHGMSNVVAGRFDPGAVAGGVREADVALDWALAVRWVGLNWFGVLPSQIVMTRDDHTDWSEVARRDDRAKAAGCTCFYTFETTLLLERHGLNPSISSQIRWIHKLFEMASEGDGQERHSQVHRAQ